MRKGQESNTMKKLERDIDWADGVNEKLIMNLLSVSGRRVETLMVSAPTSANARRELMR